MIKGLKLFIIIFLLLVCKSNAQTGKDINSLLGQLAKYGKAASHEKVYLHFDKPLYALGDTAWFKAYVVNASNNTPADQSRILYVDLINAGNVICKKLQLHIDLGFASGYIILADSLFAGNYRVRAYTRWMRNFDEAYFFSKTIQIVNPFPAVIKNIKTPPKGAGVSSIIDNRSSSANYDLQFFPEGGQLVANIPSTVGFKAVSNTGNGLTISGKIIDGQNNQVLTFQTTHAGMGSFNFIPVAGKDYKAIVNTSDGSENSFTLDKPLITGYVIHVDHSDPDSLNIILQASPELVNKEQMVLVPLTNGVPLFYFKTKFPDSKVTITIPKNKLPGGLLQLTLFNSRNEPVAERLAFNNYLHAVKIDATIKPSYLKRGITQLALSATSDGQPVTGSFSAVVTNADDVKANENNETTIFSYLLLNADLKGYIEQPNFYFTQPSPKKSIELDNLLLTQGWRRFAWKDIANDEMPATKLPHEESAIITGMVTDSKNAGFPGAHVNLVIGKFGAGVLIDTAADQNGRFAIRIPDSLIYLPMRLQANYKSKKLTISVNKATPDEVPLLYAKISTASPGNVAKQNNVYSLEYSENIIDTAAVSHYAKVAANELTVAGKAGLFSKGVLLKQVEIKDYNPKKKLVNSHSNNLNGPGEADVVITSDVLEKMINLNDIDVLLPGVGKAGYGLRLRSVVGTHTPDVLILVDGMADPEGLVKLSPRDIESIEFLKNPAYSGVYGIRGSGGVLIITTKRGTYTTSDTTGTRPNISQFRLPYQLKKEFYQPKYDNGRSTIKPGNDLRSTVYWSPNIITNKTGKATIQYFNTDVPGNYRIVIEGVSTKGYLCRQVFTYKVE